jgi:hypothetical protein
MISREKLIMLLDSDDSQRKTSIIVRDSIDSQEETSIIAGDSIDSQEETSIIAAVSIESRKVSNESLKKASIMLGEMSDMNQKLGLFNEL